MNEEALISLAIELSSRARYRELLSNPKKRDWILDKLNHNPPLDERYTIQFSSFDKAIKTITVDAKARVYILSADEEIDGKDMSYEEAIFEVPKHGWGTLIGVSNTLAIYYGECGEQAAIIKRSMK